MFERVWERRVSLRLAGVVALILVPVAVGALPDAGLATPHLQLLLLAAVLGVASLSGLAASFTAATLGFGLLLWRAVESPGSGGAGQRWALDTGAAIDAFLWFALAKLAAALVAALRRRAARLSEASGRAEAEARRRGVLLAELSHRAMNDMHMLAGTLDAQAAQAAEPETTDALRAAAGRVRVLGRVHERLSARRGAGPEADGDVADSRPFVEGLVADLRAGLGGQRPVSLTVSAESHPLPLAVMGTIGLVLNELVTNALKHAFPSGREGVVRVSFRCGDGVCELAVADNGVGLAGASATARGTVAGGQGSRLLRALAAQLGGRLDVAAGEVGGTVCKLRFPMPPSAASGRAPGEAGWPAAEEDREAVVGPAVSPFPRRQQPRAARRDGG